jgi:hypothetical protein
LLTAEIHCTSFFSTTAERRGRTQAKTKQDHYQEVTNAFDKTDEISTETAIFDLQNTLPLPRAFSPNLTLSWHKKCSHTLNHIHY